MTIIDAEGAILGRMATHVAQRLLKGETIAVINAEKAIITGKKKSIKEHYTQKREVGTYRKGPFFPRMPDRLVKRTIRGMIPYQTPHGRTAFRRLKCYIGVPKEFQGQQAEKITSAEKMPAEFMTVAELSQVLGVQF
ncbi:MAG: 50S ribosomal protein L13 [Candidatus Thermoplasmatota archaeon]|nr:50S ribosomal protein L13 [Candidatus Thermoplasmatota archaeon]MBU1942022.1 50S ribosomal protein L13 [Candidatus Thermoplasmatota archaeon]